MAPSEMHLPALPQETHVIMATGSRLPPASLFPATLGPEQRLALTLPALTEGGGCSAQAAAVPGPNLALLPGAGEPQAGDKLLSLLAFCVRSQITSGAISFIRTV